MNKYSNIVQVWSFKDTTHQYTLSTWYQSSIICLTCNTAGHLWPQPPTSVVISLRQIQCRFTLHHSSSDLLAMLATFGLHRHLQSSTWPHMSKSHLLLQMRLSYCSMKILRSQTFAFQENLLLLVMALVTVYQHERCTGV